MPNFSLPPSPLLFNKKFKVFFYVLIYRLIYNFPIIWLITGKRRIHMVPKIGFFKNIFEWEARIILENSRNTSLPYLIFWYTITAHNNYRYVVVVSATCNEKKTLVPPNENTPNYDVTANTKPRCENDFFRWYLIFYFLVLCNLIEIEYCFTYRSIFKCNSVFSVYMHRGRLHCVAIPSLYCNNSVYNPRSQLNINWLTFARFNRYFHPLFYPKNLVH